MFIGWLERIGHAKVDGTTKRIPADVFVIEREFLRTLPPSITTGNENILHTVRKGNTIVYESDCYSVPLGTFTNQKEVRIEAKDGTLHNLTVFGEPICEHSISTGRGMLVKSQEHGRDRERLTALWKHHWMCVDHRSRLSFGASDVTTACQYLSWNTRKRGSLLMRPSSYYFHKNPLLDGLAFTR